MPAVKKYTRINFQNYPSTSTPLNATNLNKMDKGIDDLDDEVVAVKNSIENLSFDADAISYDNTQSGLQATDVQGAVDEINDNLANLEERVDLMNFEFFDVRMLETNTSQGYNLNPNKITYISLVSNLASNGYGLYKVENGTLTHISGEPYTSYFNLSGNVLTIINHSYTYLGVTVAY